MRSDGLRDPRDEKGDADTENDDNTEKFQISLLCFQLSRRESETALYLPL